MKKRSSEAKERTIPVKKDASARSAHLYHFRREDGLPDEVKKDILQQMIDYALNDKNSKVITIRSILRKFNLKKRTFNDWLNYFPEFKEEFEEVKEVFADRKYIHAAFRVADPNVVRGAYGDYDHEELIPRYKQYRDEMHQRALEIEKYKVDLRKELQEDISEIVVKMQEIARKPQDG